MARTLAELFVFLDELDERAGLDRLTSELQELEVDCSDVSEFVRFSDRGYMRNLVRAGDWYNVLVLCWKNGQRSPIHDHAGSTCGVRILRGTATETVFEFAPHGHVWATHSRKHRPGSVIGSQ